MREGDSTVVFKYFDLIDGFIRIRVLSEDDIGKTLREEARPQSLRVPPAGRRGVRRGPRELREGAALRACGSDPSAVEDLLYQLCIDVNPRLEIHQVALPAAAWEGMPEGIADCEVMATLRELQRKVVDLDGSLRRLIIGQDASINTVTRALRKAAVGLAEPNRPIGCFLFVGRTGTGKTALAKAIAKHLYDGPQHFIRVDCTEYSLPHEVAKLIGAPPDMWDMARVDS